MSVLARSLLVLMLLGAVGIGYMQSGTTPRPEVKSAAKEAAPTASHPAKKSPYRLKQNATQATRKAVKKTESGVHQEQGKENTTSGVTAVNR